MARKKNVTFNDIAQYTHFSKTTISRYFNNPDSLTPENQQIISDALDKLNYKENKVAKILANGQTEFVGVLIPSLSMNYYSEMLNQILASYEKYGYKFLVFAGNGHDETEHRYIQELMSYKIEASSSSPIHSPPANSPICRSRSLQLSAKTSSSAVSIQTTTSARTKRLRF